MKIVEGGPTKNQTSSPINPSTSQSVKPGNPSIPKPDDPSTCQPNDLSISWPLIQCLDRITCGDNFVMCTWNYMFGYFSWPDTSWDTSPSHSILTLSWHSSTKSSRQAARTIFLPHWYLWSYNKSQWLLLPKRTLYHWAIKPGQLWLFVTFSFSVFFIYLFINIVVYSRPRAIIDSLSSSIDFMKKGIDPRHKQLFSYVVCYNNDLTFHTARSLIIHTTILWRWKSRWLHVRFPYLLLLWASVRIGVYLTV